MNYKLLILIILSTICIISIQQYSLIKDQIKLKFQKQSLQFGHDMLSLFEMESDLINVNSGSYGVCPKEVMNKKNQYAKDSEKNPERWFRETVEESLKEVRQEISKYVNAGSSDEIVFVENASDAFNAVVKSLGIFQWQKGDKIISTNFSYSMVKKTIQYLIETYQIENIEVQFNISNIQSEILIFNAWRQIIDQNLDAKLLVVDHISSTPALIFPIKKIISYAHSKNIAVVVDGAHAVGQIPLDMKDYNADFYFSNFYKWCYAPKAVSFLYINIEKYSELIHPNIIAKYYQQGWEREFFWTGTRDFSNQLAVKDAIQFRESLGEEKVLNYMHDLCVDVGQTVSQIWGTYVLLSDSDLIGGMVNVKAPVDEYMEGYEITQQIFHNNNSYIVLFDINSVVYARFSCQIFNEISDYVKVANLFLEYQKQQKVQKNKIN